MIIIINVSILIIGGTQKVPKSTKKYQKVPKKEEPSQWHWCHWLGV
jgi:hypothetical protein